MGAETFLLSSSINAIVGQRIVRRLCQVCKAAYPPPPQLLETMKKDLGPLFPQGESKFYRTTGCGECDNSGYKGRVGIFEVLPVSQKIAALLLSRSDSLSLEKEAIAEGMMTMKQDGYIKVLKGVTTVEEVLRVAQE